MDPSGIRKSKSSFLDGFKTEWHLFWESIIGDEPGDQDSPELKDPFVTGKLEQLTLDQIKSITKALSADRKELHQRLEKITQEIQEHHEKLEALTLVGGELDETREYLADLTDVGQELNEKLNRINDRLTKARQTEDQLKKQKKS